MVEEGAGRGECWVVGAEVLVAATAVSDISLYRIPGYMHSLTPSPRHRPCPPTGSLCLCVPLDLRDHPDQTSPRHNKGTSTSCLLDVNIPVQRRLAAEMHQRQDESRSAQGVDWRVLRLVGASKSYKG